MIRNYSNKQIDKNFKTVKFLSIIALIVAILTVITYTCQKYINYPNSGIGQNQIIFYMFALIIPINPFIVSTKPYGRKFVGKFQGETKLNNDFSNLLTQIIISFIPYMLLVFYYLLFMCFHSPYPIEWAYLCGYMLPAHIWVYIADIFLIHNCILIKREWKDNPPDFVKEQQAKNEHKKMMQVDAKNMEQYKRLIEKCGIKFFVKYYDQIKRLPLRDIEVSENYSPTEREERLVAAKKIIDLNLAEFALNEILKSYSDILTENEIEQAKSLLSKI